MPRRVAEEDWDGGEGDWDDAQDSLDEAPDDEPTIPCHYCKKQIHEDSPQCPYCGQYLSEEDTPPPRKPWWIIVGALLCLYVVYRWIAG